MSAHGTACREFLAVAEGYRLGDLVTEQPHPASRQLSDLASRDVRCAVGILKLIDTAALTALLERGDALTRLAGRIAATLDAGRRVYLCGCGATGRLSLVLEALWRAERRGSGVEDRVIAFMAGGDLALVRSVENFEDFPGYGRRQLVELGFEDGDLLVACSEGGETPFVIGATERAAELSRNRPFLLHCNPEDLLRRTVERSRKVIDDPRIETISLPTGPMAITGSTRMQASSALMAAVGVALLLPAAPERERTRWIRDLIRHWESLDLGDLDDLISREAELYEADEYLLYETDDEYGISVLTDTTERAPTFSLHPFENPSHDGDEPLSRCYLYLPDAADSQEAWQRLLGRRPRTLEWPEVGGGASRERLLGFDFSRGLLSRRLRESDATPHHRLRIQGSAEGISLELEDDRMALPTAGLGRLGAHLLLKMALNIHSTLVMGRLGRYEGNVMTWVRPSNNKLIDRCIRYVDLLLGRAGQERSYSEIAARLFQVAEGTPADRSLVLAVTDSFLQETDLPEADDDADRQMPPPEGLEDPDAHRWRYGSDRLRQAGPLLLGGWTAPIVAHDPPDGPDPDDDGGSRRVAGAFLLDTGASASCISLPVARELGLEEEDRSRTYGSSGAHELPVFRAGLLLRLDPEDDKPTYRIRRMRVRGLRDLERASLAMELSAEERLIGILGRDFLRHLTFRYDGVEGSVSIAFTAKKEEG